MSRRASTNDVDQARATSRRAGATRRDLRIGGDELTDVQLERLVDVFERGANVEPEDFWYAAKAVRELQARRGAELRATSRVPARATSRRAVRRIPRGAT